jgi:hypothetical protein
MAGMGLAGIDDAFELGVGQQAVATRLAADAADRRGFGGATEAIAADCTSLVGCA